MPALRKTSPEDASFAYAAPFPYSVKTRKKGRRTLETTLVKGLHHGQMPVVDAARTTPVFRITHANGIRNDIVAWNGGLWAEMRDLAGRPLTPERFAGQLAGRDVETRGAIPTVHAFDPFSSPLNWKDGEPWNGALVGGHISGNPESPADPSGTLEFDGEPAARARAARIAERLAVIDGVVSLRIPGPMWQVSDPADFPSDRRRRPDLPKVVVRPEWRFPMRPLDGDFRISHQVADHRPGPVLVNGNFFAWNEKNLALAEAGMTAPGTLEEGAIAVLDPKLAAELTAPDDALAATAAAVLMRIVGETAPHLMQLSDHGVGRWMEARRAAVALAETWFGDVATARRGMAAMEQLVDEFGEIAKSSKSTSANGIVAFCGPIMRRWRTVEKPRAMADVGDLAPQDVAAVAAMRP